MNCVILAAGYATRLYPLTQNTPKPLLEIGGKTVIDRLLDQLSETPFEQIVVVTNARFEQQFRDWAPAGIEVVANASVEADDRQGAVADLLLGLDQCGSAAPCLVSAADNINPFSVAEFVRAYTGDTQAAVWFNPSQEDQTRRGNVVREANRITQFVEKPNPAVSSWAAAPLYLLNAEDCGRVSAFLDGHPRLEQRDAPGHFFA